MCILAAHDARVPWAIESVASRRQDAGSSASWPRFSSHCTLWDFLSTGGLAPSAFRRPGVHYYDIDVCSATFAMCAFGAPYQKYTTVWASQSALPLLANLRDRDCPHGLRPHEQRLRGLTPAGVPLTSAAEVLSRASRTLLSLVFFSEFD